MSSDDLSGILSGKLSVVLAGIYSDIVLAFYLTHVLTFYLAYLVTSYWHYLALGSEARGTGAQGKCGSGPAVPTELAVDVTRVWQCPLTFGVPLRSGGEEVRGRTWRRKWVARGGRQL